MRRLFLALVLAFATLVAASCGGGHENKPLSKSEYEAQLGAILRPLQEKTLRAVIMTSPADAEKAVRRIKSAETALHDDAAKLADMKPPADAAAPTAQIARGIEQIADRLTAARKDAERGNFGRLEQFKSRITVDPAVARVRAAIVQLINLGYNVVGNAP